MSDKRILLIDDDATVRATVGALLTASGYCVLTADTGESGFDVARSEHPDLVLLDIQLPGSDGFSTCIDLKSDPVTSVIPVIMLTGLDGAENVVKGLNIGADDYVMKPFDARELEARIAASLRRASAQPAGRAKRSPETALPQGYEPVDVVGRGVTSTVYKARQVVLDRLVAVKVLSAKWLADPECVERFLREARMAAKLMHPNIVSVLDAVEHGDTYCLVMEFVEGSTVQDLIEGGRAMEESEALRVVRDVALGLEHARERGLVHRDVKPANIIVGPDGASKLTDLGVAQDGHCEDLAVSEESSHVVGTPYYIAPEQIRGETTDTRADVYSLGASLFHMLTGSPPFPGSTAQQFVKHVYERTPDAAERKPGVGAGAAGVATTAMAKDPGDRYKTPAAMAAAIDEVLGVAGRPSA